MKGKRRAVAIALVIVALLGGFTLLGSAEDVEGDTSTNAATLLVLDGEDYTVVDGYTDLRLALNYFNGSSSPAGSYMVVLNQAVTVPETYIINQTEGKNLIIDGNNQTFTSQFSIYGNARDTGEETLELKNIKFSGDISSLSNQPRDFIEQDSTESAKRYPHNVTISYCTFDLEPDHVAMRFRQSYNIVIDHCTVNGGHSALQATGSGPITVQHSTVTGSKNGLSFGTVLGAKVTDTTISATNGYGIRFNGEVDTEVTVEDSTVTAKIPVVVRKATSDSYTVKFSGTNTMVPNNSDGLWFAAGVEEYGDEGINLENIGTSVVKVVAEDEGLDLTSMCPAFALPGGGTENNPWTIGSAEDLETFRYLAYVQGHKFEGEYVEVQADIDWQWRDWTPINFYGIFDGQDHTIMNLNYIPRSDGKMGFFQLLQGTAENLTLDGITGTLPDNGQFGGFARYQNGHAMDVHVKNITLNIGSKSDWIIGGFFGYVNWGDATDCSVENFTIVASDTLVSGDPCVGGFIASIRANSTYTNCDVKGFNVNINSTTGLGIGGFSPHTQTGWNHCKFIDCDVTGIDITVSGTADVAGFITWPGSHTTATNCTTSGKIDVTGVTVGDYVGGFYGSCGWNPDYGQKGHLLTDCSADVDITTKGVRAGGFIGSATVHNNGSKYLECFNCSASGDITAVEGSTAAIGGFAGDADRGVYSGCSASGTVTNNGTGSAGQFIGEFKKVTPNYDYRYPAGTRDYPPEYAVIEDCEYRGPSVSLEFIGKKNDGIHIFESSVMCAVRTCTTCEETHVTSAAEHDVPYTCKASVCAYCEELVGATTSHTADNTEPCNVVCGVCGEAMESAEHTPTTGHTCKDECRICGTPLGDGNHDPLYDCKASECSICHDTIEPTAPHTVSDQTCIDRECSVCHEMVSGNGDHDPLYDCKESTCSICGLDVYLGLAHTPRSEHTCIDTVCEVCGDSIAKKDPHDLPSSATCIDRTCEDCGTVVEANKSHDYRTSGYQNICRDCGHTVDLPFQDDDDDDWYLQWLAQQQAKAEAERLAKERAEQEAEEKKKVAAVALATGVALIMALLLMSTYRRS